MKKPVSIDDILSSVEFELLQGMLPDDELSKSVHELRAYQTKARADLFGDTKRAPTLDEIADLQLRLNEMLLTLIEVLGQRFAMLQQGFAQAQRRSDAAPHAADLPQPANAPLADAPPAEVPAARVPTAEVPPAELSLSHAEQRARILSTYATPATGLDLGERTDTALQDLGLTDGEPAFEPISETLRMGPDIQPVRVPILGGFLTRLRLMIHELVLFYVNRLGAQQSAINQQLVRQNLALYRILAGQTEQMRQLRLELGKLNEEIRSQHLSLAGKADPAAATSAPADSQSSTPPGDA